MRKSNGLQELFLSYKSTDAKGYWIQMYRESGPQGSQTVPRALTIVQARPGQYGHL